MSVIVQAFLNAMSRILAWIQIDEQPEALLGWEEIDTPFENTIHSLKSLPITKDFLNLENSN